MAKQNLPKPTPKSDPEPRIGKQYPATISDSGGRILSKGKAEMTSSTGGMFFPNLSGSLDTPITGEVRLETPGLRAAVVLEKICSLDVHPIHQHFCLK